MAHCSPCQWPDLDQERDPGKELIQGPLHLGARSPNASNCMLHVCNKHLQETLALGTKVEVAVGLVQVVVLEHLLALLG